MASRKRDNCRLRPIAAMLKSSFEHRSTINKNIKKIDTQQVDRQYKMNKETNNRRQILHRKLKIATRTAQSRRWAHMLWKLMFPLHYTYHDTVKTIRTSYDMECVLNSVKHRLTHISVKINIHTPDRQKLYKRIMSQNVHVITKEQFTINTDKATTVKKKPQ